MASGTKSNSLKLYPTHYFSEKIFILFIIFCKWYFSSLTKSGVENKAKDQIPINKTHVLQAEPDDSKKACNTDPPSHPC